MAAADRATIVVLERCRRRLRLVDAVRRAGVTVAAAVIAVEAVALFARPQPLTLALIGVTAIGLALTGAAAAALVRAPSLRDAAVALDRRLLLQDRIVTAFQVGEDTDPMARLVVQDAERCVADVSLPRVFPLQTPPQVRSIVIGVVAISSVFAITMALTSPSWGQYLARIGSATGAGGVGGTQAGAQAGPRSPTAPAPGNVPAASETIATDGSTRRADSAVQVPASVAEPATSRDLGRSPAGLKTGGSRGPTASEASPSDGGATGTGAGGDGGRVSTMTAPQLTGNAGGVKGGQLQDAAASRAGRGSDPRDDRAYAARARRASAHSQTAIAQERVPPALRPYVKAYFTAIRP